MKKKAERSIEIMAKYKNVEIFEDIIHLEK